MEYIRRLANALALVVGAACARPIAQSSVPPVAAAVPESVVDSLALDRISIDYRWTGAQRDSAIDVLAANRAKWVAYRPDTYEYWEREWCFCFSMWSGPRLIVIRNERLVSATDTSGRRADTAYMKALRGKVAGIDALFARVAIGIRDTTIAEVRVSYDESHGYPVAITYDRSLFVADDEFYISVSHVRGIR
jgi:hypothetical protein